MEVVVTTGAIRRANLLSKCHPQTNQHPVFTGWMSFLLPNQQSQSTEGRLRYSNYTTANTTEWQRQRHKLHKNWQQW